MSKEKIPQAVRIAVWNTYVGRDVGVSECLVGCGNLMQISNFESGHIISKKNGGQITIQNLRPICSTCNKSIGSKDMIKFIRKYGFESKMLLTHDKTKEDIYLNFLNECTEESDVYIRSVDLYNYFKEWYARNNSDKIIPTQRKFSIGIKKYKKIEKVRINEIVTSGIKNLDIRKEE